MKKHTIAILLATYNGEHYLRPQLDSLFAQTLTDWTLYIHDDGSTDGTKDILQDYDSRHDNMVILDYPSQHGASNNFFSLLQHVEASYYFFCDQDDVWMPEKMERTMARMQQAEADRPGCPILACCDACVANKDMKVTAPSLWQQAGTHPEFLTTFDEAAATPFVTGCTMLINKAAKETVLWDKTQKATMHDAFITLCVLRAGGVVVPLRESLMLYRQHGENTLGAYSRECGRLVYKLTRIGRILKYDFALLNMLQALGYGSLLKFLKYKRLYKQRCRKAELKQALHG